MLKDLSHWPRGRRATTAERLQAAGAHLTLSLCVAALAFAVVYWVWFPREFWEMSGGRELFFLVVSVDVVLGPLITLAIFNPGKGWGRMKFDLCVVLALQAAALAYGLWTVSAARPAYLVHAVDRFNVVTAVQLDPADQALAQNPRYRAVPWLGPETVGTRLPSDGEEKLKLVDLAMAGKDVELQPRFYIPYADARASVLAKARPIADLRKKNPAQALRALDERMAAMHRDEATLRWLPVVARGDWVALVDAATAEPLAFLPLNGF